MNNTYIDKTLSRLYKDRGLFTTITVNGLLMSFEKDQDGRLKLDVYDCSEYDTYDLELHLATEFPISVNAMDKYMQDKILGMITREQT
jgi:hypothetical protein